MTTRVKQGVPRVVDLFVPTIRALKTLGGSASIEEIDDRVAEIANISDVVRSELHNDGPRTKLQYRCAWARSWLKHAGLVTNSDRGVWALTPAGDGVSEADYPSLPSRVRQAVYEIRKSRKTQSNRIVTDESGDEISEREVENEDWKEKLLDSISEMSPAGFERLAQRILREAGFTRVFVTGRSGDGGIDGTGVLRVNLLSFHVLFQCKKWKGSVGASVVRDFRGAMMGRADKGLIITTSTFSPDARKEATRDGAPAIDLVDGEGLCNLLKEYKLGVSVELVESVAINNDFFRAI